MKSRAGCALFIEEAGLRINRLPTRKPHALLRPGDVLTLDWRGAVRVIRVLALAKRRGPPAEARGLYEALGETDPCAAAESPALPRSDET